MPRLSMYANEDDLHLVAAWLNGDPDVAFVVPAGEGRWIAVQTLESLSPGLYCLWHIPTGPLFLVPPGGGKMEVLDPFAGWTEPGPSGMPGVPSLDPDGPGIIWFRANPEGRNGALGLSSFEWLEHWEKASARKPPAVTMQWWQRLRRWVKNMAIKVPRTGPIAGPNADVWAFPSAYREIAAGRPRDESP